MEGSVYLLCALTAIACAFLLLRGYRRTRLRLLLWCGVFFVGLMLENAILFLDLILIPPSLDLAIVRYSAALMGTLLLLYGLIWDAET